MKRPRPVDPARAAKDAAAWALLGEVLAGRATPLVDAGGKKMTFMLRCQDTDAVISATQFAVHLGARRGKKGAYTYFFELAPQFIGAAMRDAGLPRLDAPTVIALPKGLRPGGPSSPTSATFVWIVPGDPVLMRTRRATLPVDRAWAAPIDHAGPLAFPEDLPLKPGFGPPLYRQFDPPRACPKCAVAGSEFRVLDKSLVCRSCGCSSPASP